MKIFSHNNICTDEPDKGGRLTPSDFDYHLPDELIAQSPSPERGGSRMMVLNKGNGRIEHRMFSDLAEYLSDGDFLVFNDTRVIPARLFGYKKDTGGQAEILLVNRIEENIWETLAKPGRRIKKGHRLIFGDGLMEGVVLDVTDKGTRIIQFETVDFFDSLEKIGLIPLPPYIKNKIEDEERYQTVFSRHPGSSAAPTAGLHFTPETFEKLKGRGVRWTYITLHVGPGTFLPVKSDTIGDHVMHSEHFSMTPESIENIIQAKKDGKRIIPVGTTSCRTLESAFDGKGRLLKSEGWTDIFIYPGYRFKMTDCLFTNFHLPKSTLIMLISALAGREFVLSAYNSAVREKYRFFSLGDCMLIL